LALRIYRQVIGDRRRRSTGARLVAVLRGVEWAETGRNADPEPLMAVHVS